MNTRKALTLKTSCKAGGISQNHNQSALTLKTSLKAGGVRLNHNQSTR